MSFLDDLSKAAERIADKVLDFRVTETSLINQARAAGGGTASPSPIVRRPLSTTFERALPWIAAAGIGLAVVLAMRR